jgi:hypothetical protein
MANEYRITSITFDVLESFPANVKLTAINLDTLVNVPSGARVTTTTIDILIAPQTDVRVTSLTVDALHAAPAAARASSVSVDALITYDPPVPKFQQIATLVAEVVNTRNPPGAIAALTAEVVRSTSLGPTAVRVPFLIAEVIRAVALGGRKRAAQIIG